MDGTLLSSGQPGHSPWVDNYRRTLALIYAGALLFFLLLGLYEWRQIGRYVESLAVERGRVLFSLIELTRDWNAKHGGVYVPVTEGTQPNPHLKEDPTRDVTGSDGRQYTKINPAYMTRQIAEVAEQASGVRLHITSLKPLRPENRADDWEARALALFERDAEVTEYVEFVERFDFGGRTTPAHRYMAPLHVKKYCLKCHESQGYRVGDIRGGISVTMPAGDLLSVLETRRLDNLWLILIGFVLTTALLHAAAAMARRHYRVLQGIAQGQEEVIAERTRELEERNDALRGEVEERRRREGELRIAGAVFESAAEAIVVTDADNNIVRVNPAFTAITGYTPREVLGRNPKVLKSGRHDKPFYDEMWGMLEARGHWEGEIWNRHKNGNIYVEWLSISRIDEGSGPAGRYLAVFHDITRRKEAEELLRHKAHHDALTDLPNRVLFYDRLQAAFNQAHRYNRMFALLLVDLDRFKEVNDTLGHAAGDELLVEAARRLASCVRESDSVARLGGDEFAIILSEMTGEGEAEQVAQRAVELLAEPYLLDAGTVRISGCVGVALYPRHGRDSDELQRAADIALYAAKESGRNAWRVYSPIQRDAKTQGDLL
jgi:diguanylate cyclase (GGDEF)-like protein/PAS domain S-box-containing protein